MLKAFAVALLMGTSQPAVVDNAEGAKLPTVSKTIIVVEQPAGKRRPRNTW